LFTNDQKALVDCIVAVLVVVKAQDVLLVSVDVPAEVEVQAAVEMRRKAIRCCLTEEQQLLEDRSVKQSVESVESSPKYPGYLPPQRNKKSVHVSWHKNKKISWYLTSETLLCQHIGSEIL